MFGLFKWLLVVLGVIMSVIFFTMLERKIMSYMQKRKGPNKVGFLGLITPVADALKLLVKGTGQPLKANSYLYWLSPILSIVLLVGVWFFFPFLKSKISVEYGFLFFLCLSSLKVYGLLGSGWGSNSKYSLLGSLRGAAQTMSYEVCLIFIAFFPFIFLGSFNMSNFFCSGFLSFWLLNLVVLWVMVSVAETNRAPLDFSEGESELVSGFKTEYGAMEFACLFLGEYGQMIFLGFLTVLIWFPMNNFVVIFLGVFISLAFIWFRSTYPRFRYDLLMELAWMLVLPYILLLLNFLFVF